MAELHNCRLCGSEPDVSPSGNDVVFSCENEKCPMHGYEFAFSVWQALMGQGEAVAVSKGGSLFWIGDPTEMRGTNCELYLHPAPAVDDAVVRELIVKTMSSYIKEMEGYAYFGSNPGIDDDDIEEIADEIISAMKEQGDAKS